jgi:hypothetical protein
MASMQTVRIRFSVVDLIAQSRCAASDILPLGLALIAIAVGECAECVMRFRALLIGVYIAALAGLALLAILSET